MGFADPDDPVAAVGKNIKQFYEDTMKKMEKKPCDGSRADLRDCLLQSDCYLKQHRPIKECLKARDGTVPDQCYALRITFFECKRSLLDNRQRFRGRKGY